MPFFLFAERHLTDANVRLVKIDHMLGVTVSPEGVITVETLPAKKQKRSHDTDPKTADGDSADINDPEYTPPAPKKKKKKHRHRETGQTGEHDIPEDIPNENSRRENKPKKKKKRSSEEGKEISTKDLGPKSRRKDGKARKQYAYQTWRRSGGEEDHISIFGRKEHPQIHPTQAIPGYCTLCPRKFHGMTEQHHITHFQRVHVKHSAKVCDKLILLCKCSNKDSRGDDTECRNAHYHCPVCEYAADRKKQLAAHMINRHSIKPKKVRRLMD